MKIVKACYFTWMLKTHTLPTILMLFLNILFNHFPILSPLAKKYKKQKPLIEFLDQLLLLLRSPGFSSSSSNYLNKSQYIIISNAMTLFINLNIDIDKNKINKMYVGYLIRCVRLVRDQCINHTCYIQYVVLSGQYYLTRSRASCNFIVEFFFENSKIRTCFKAWHIRNKHI